MIITELFIPGRPVTKGSLTQRRAGGPLTDTPQSKAWRRVMAGAIRDDLRRRVIPGSPAWVPFLGPVMVHAMWWLPVDPLHHGAGDIDKLVRNLLDALSAPNERTTDASLCSGAIRDDNQVIALNSGQFYDPVTPGVVVRVETLSREFMDGCEPLYRRERAALTA